MLEADDASWIPYMGDHRGNLRLSGGSSRVARRAKTNDMPALWKYLAGVIKITEPEGAGGAVPTRLTRNDIIDFNQ